MIEYIILGNNELDYLIERHILWLETKGLRGECFNMKKIDFRNYNLENKNLSKAKLVSSNFSGLNLKNINLSGANISKADFSNSSMKDANLSGINAPNSNFYKANIDESNLRMGNFRTANFSNAKVNDSFLERIILNQADLSNANFDKSNLKMAKLNKAKLINCSLRDTNLTQTNLISANLEDADITGTVFWQVQNAYWNITNIKCDYLFIDETGKHRLPATGFFQSNEAMNYLNKIELVGIKKEDESITHNKLEKIIQQNQLFVVSRGKEGTRANLSNINFKEIILNNKDLRGAILDFSDFENADLRWSILQGAKLRNTKLDKAKLFRVNLEGANLRGASLREASLSEANLKYTKFSWTNMEGSVLKKAYLVNSYLDNTNLQRANFTNANLRDSTLRNATLLRANLTNANLTNAYLGGCNLTGANLTNATLTGAIFNSTHTEGWIIKNIKCDYIFFDKEGKLRTPTHRNFEEGEFEELYSWFPSFVYYFKDAMHALDPYLMSLIVSSLNKTIEGLHLDIDEIKARGLAPQVVLSVKSEHDVTEIEMVINKVFDDKLAILNEKFARIESSMTDSILPLIENSIEESVKKLPLSSNINQISIFSTNSKHEVTFKQKD